MEEFSLEKYLKNPNRKVVTRDGKDVRIVCTDLKGTKFPIIALYEDDIHECFDTYRSDGRSCDQYELDTDLFFAPEPKTKKVGWMNVCKYGDNQHFSLVGGVIHPTREQALAERPDYVVDTIQIRWEE